MLNIFGTGIPLKNGIRVAIRKRDVVVCYSAGRHYRVRGNARLK